MLVEVYYNVVNVGILGSGFGLYGYLPSIVKLNWQPIILQKTFDALALRPELQGFSNSVQPVAKFSELVEASDHLVVALPPAIQFDVLKALLPFDGHLFLEKPLAHDMSSHVSLIDVLSSTSQKFSVGYLFRYTRIYQEIVNHIVSNRAGMVRIKWRVNPGNSDWKHDLSLGGGLFPFYGIHFSELLFEAQIDFSEMRIRAGAERILLSVIIAERPRFELDISYSERSFFSVSLEDELLAVQQNPFGDSNRIGVPDNRIELLTEYLTDFHKVSVAERLALENYALKLRMLFDEAFKA